MIGKLQGKDYARQRSYLIYLFTVDAGTSVFLTSAQKHAEVIVHVRNKIKNYFTVLLILFAYWC